MIRLNEFGGSRLASVAARFSRLALAGARQAHRYLSVSLGHDVFWPQRSLSLSIERGALTVVYGARVFSRIGIRGARQYAFEPDKYPQPEATVSSLKLAAAEMHAPLRNIILVIPREWVIARTIDLPATVAENLQRAVSFELDRFTPLSADDALYDFLPLSQNEETLRLFLAVCRADVVNPYLEALQGQAITVGRITTGLTAAGTASSYMTNANRLAFAEIDKGGFAGGVVIDGRVFALFADEFNGEGADERAGRVREELSRAAAPITNGTAVAEAVMVRDGSITPVTIKRLMASVTLLNDLDSKRLHLKGPLPGALTLGHRGSVIEGLWSRAEGVDLLAKGERRRPRSPVGLTLLLLVAIAAMVVIYAIAPLTIERRRVDEIERQIRLMKGPVRQVEALKKEIEAQEKENGAIEGFKSGRILAVDILREVTKVLPKNAWLTRARITETNVDLEGYAGSAAEILPKLESSPFLKKVEFASPTFRDTRLNADRFVIKMEIENDKKPDAGRPRNEVKK
jgi:Tfp pilus assembly protein PilN